MQRSLCLSLALALLTSLPALAQDAQPAKAVSFKGKVVFTTIATVDDERISTTKVYDGATGKVTTLAENAFCNAVSPAGKTFCTISKAGEGEFQVRSFAKPDKVLVSLPKIFTWPSYVDEDTLLIPHYKPQGDPNVKFELLKLSIKSGEKVAIASFPLSSWDDVPARLTPDGKQLAFFLNAEPRGMQVLDLAKGTHEPLPDVTMLNWGPDSKHCVTWSKPKREMALQVLEGTKLKSVEVFPKGAVLGEWISKTELVYGKADFQTRKASLVLRDLASKKETVLTDAFPLGEGTLLTLVAKLPEAGTLACLESTADGSRSANLILVRIKDGKVSKTTLVEDLGRPGLIFAR